MKTFNQITILVLSLLAFSSFPLSANLPNLQEIQREGVTKMRNGDWQGAWEVFANATARFDGNAPMLFGPRFGYFWYHKGYCELKLSMWEEAAESFETCYVRYANKGDEGADRRNAYDKRALLKWGDALRGDKQFGEALKRYEKFLAERDKERDKFSPGELYIGMAVCNFQKDPPSFEEGLDLYRTALKNKIEYRVSNYDIMVCFNFFCRGLLDSERSDSEIEEIFLSFLSEHRQDILLDAYEMPAYTQMVLRLAARSAERQMVGMSSELFAMIPESKYVASQLEQQLEQIGNRPVVQDGRVVKQNKTMRAHLTQARENMETAETDDVTALIQTGNLSFRMGNYRGAYGAFLHLEQTYPNHPRREDSLFQLVQLAALLNEVLLTEEFGSRFLKDFPESSYKPAVESLMLGSLFAAGKYELCLEVATRLKPAIPEGTEQYDTCVHVLGGSNYYLGNFQAAEPHLEEHFEKHPKSKHRIASYYFYAANPSRLLDFERSEQRLEAFLKEFPNSDENPFIPFARYDLATCKFDLEKNSEALELLSSIESDFPGAGNMQQVYVLKGNVLRAEKRTEEAEEYYLMARDLAERREDGFVASEALYSLVALLGEELKGSDEPNPRFPDAVKYYDEFFEKYPNSVFRPEAAVAGLPSMVSQNRADEALERLQRVIVELGKTRSRGLIILEQAINSYRDAFLAINGPEALRDHFFDFPGVGISDVELRALLTITVIGVYESILEEAKAANDDAAAINAQSAIGTFFNRLRRDFEPSQLTNYVAIRLADYIRLNTSTPEEAMPFIERVLTNPDDTAFREDARFAKADVLGKSSSPADNDEAIALLNELASTEGLERAKLMRAQYAIIKIHFRKNDWAALERATKAYLDERSNQFNRAEVFFWHARSFEEQGKMEEAIGAYNRFFGAFLGRVGYSAPAMLRYVQLLEKRGKIDEKSGKSDLQLGYENAAAFINATKGQIDKFKADDLEEWRKVEELVKTLERGGRVIPMSELENNRR